MYAGIMNDTLNIKYMFLLQYFSVWNKYKRIIFTFILPTVNILIYLTARIYDENKKSIKKT